MLDVLYIATSNYIILCCWYCISCERLSVTQTQIHWPLYVLHVNHSCLYLHSCLSGLIYVFSIWFTVIITAYFFPNLSVCLQAQHETFPPPLNIFLIWIKHFTGDSFASATQNLEIDSDAVHCLSTARWDPSKLHFKPVYPHWALWWIRIIHSRRVSFITQIFTLAFEENILGEVRCIKLVLYHKLSVNLEVSKKIRSYLNY